MPLHRLERRKEIVSLVTVVKLDRDGSRTWQLVLVAGSIHPVLHPGSRLGQLWISPAFDVLLLLPETRE